MAICGLPATPFATTLITDHGPKPTTTQQGPSASLPLAHLYLGLIAQLPALATQPQPCALLESTAMVLARAPQAFLGAIRAHWVILAARSVFQVSYYNDSGIGISSMLC